MSGPGSTTGVQGPGHTAAATPNVSLSPEGESAFRGAANTYRDRVTARANAEVAAARAEGRPVNPSNIFRTDDLARFGQDLARRLPLRDLPMPARNALEGVIGRRLTPDDLNGSLQDLAETEGNRVLDFGRDLWRSHPELVVGGVGAAVAAVAAAGTQGIEIPASLSLGDGYTLNTRVAFDSGVSNPRVEVGLARGDVSVRARMELGEGGDYRASVTGSFGAFEVTVGASRADGTTTYDASARYAGPRANVGVALSANDSGDGFAGVGANVTVAPGVELGVVTGATRGLTPGPGGRVHGPSNLFDESLRPSSNTGVFVGGGLTIKIPGS